jgi:hypothetical protein
MLAPRCRDQDEGGAQQEDGSDAEDGHRPEETRLARRHGRLHVFGTHLVRSWHMLRVPTGCKGHTAGA